MSAAAAWITSILGVVIVGTLIDLILPSGRMNKYIKSVFAAVTVLVIVLPLPSLIRSGFKPEGGKLFAPEFSLDSRYIEYADAVKFGYLARGVEKMLKEDGMAGVSVKIEGGFSGHEPVINLVSANLQNLVIDKNLEHINKYERTRDLIAQYLNVPKDAVIIYE
ncbi:MAG: stage III sporulation protein AF [Clostridiales bacterium]|jgi:hypothetical protein|nr:stage III sporulation protein AF [Clostridiales bacterium]